MNAIPNDRTKPKSPKIKMSKRLSYHAYFAADTDVYANPIDAPIDAISKTQPITARPIKHVRLDTTVQNKPALVGTPFLLM